MLVVFLIGFSSLFSSSFIIFFFSFFIFSHLAMNASSMYRFEWVWAHGAVSPPYTEFSASGLFMSWRNGDGGSDAGDVHDHSSHADGRHEGACHATSCCIAGTSWMIVLTLTYTSGTRWRSKVDLWRIASSSGAVSPRLPSASRTTSRPRNSRRSRL